MAFYRPSAQDMREQTRIKVVKGTSTRYLGDVLSNASNLYDPGGRRNATV